MDVSNMNLIHAYWCRSYVKHKPWPIYVSVLPTEVSVNTGATCAASSTYNQNHLCDKALDGSTGDWASLNQNVGAWISVQLSQSYFITRIELKGRCVNAQGATPNRVMFTFDDESTEEVSP